MITWQSSLNQLKSSVLDSSAHTTPGQVYELERNLLDGLSFAKFCDGSMPNPSYSFL